jgi:uncharacterized protein YndB with AHSA1/START domain
MTDIAPRNAYGVVTEPATVRLQRMLPGPIERVWSYLTESELRGQWLATGNMDLRVGGKVELVWHNDDLTGRREDRPPEFTKEEYRQESLITRLEAPRLLAFGWEGGSEVTFELEPRRGEVLLTITHRKLPSRDNMLGVSSGWHAHVDIFEARLRGDELPLFWRNWKALRAEYDKRIPQ